MNTARLDLSDPALADALTKVRSDASPETYCVFGYEGKSKIVLKDMGTGNCYECIKGMDDAEISYALLRVTGTRDQESKTVKFVFICYVGPSVGGMQKGRVNGHKGDVKTMIGQSHVDIQADDKADISEEVITGKLKKASGANYDLGSNAGGAYESNAKSIGASAAAKYRELEKTSNIGPVVFDKGPAKPKDYVTPVDLGGRPMVAPPTQAKKNTVIRDEKSAAQKEKDEVTERERLAALAARTKDGKTAASEPVKLSAVPAPAPPPPAPAAPPPEPEATREPTPTPMPAAPETAPEPEATPEPLAEAAPLPVPEAAPGPVPEASPEPVPEAAPLPEPEAAPLQEPEAAPAPLPEAAPEPVPEAAAPAEPAAEESAAEAPAEPTVAAEETPP